MTDFSKKNPFGYKKLSKYLVEKDMNAVGTILKESEGEWSVYSEKDDMGKRIMLQDGFKTRNDAREWSVNREVAKYNGTKEEKAALKSFRIMTGRLYDHYIQGWNEIIEEYESRGLALPEVVTESSSGEARVNIKVALAQMGGRESYYFPRIRNNGDWRVVGKKQGGDVEVRFVLDAKLRCSECRGEMMPDARVSEESLEEAF